MRWYKVGVDEKNLKAKVILPERRSRRNFRPQKRSALNYLSRELIGVLIASRHYCPRCRQELVYIGLTTAKGVNCVVKACPKCNHRQGWSYLNSQEVRIF